jgi:hypothetical protein
MAGINILLVLRVNLLRYVAGNGSGERDESLN